MPVKNLVVKIIHSLESIEFAQWQQLQNDNFPFTDYEFLKGLESTGCIGERTGWLPTFVTVWSENLLCGAFILYVKNNSYGEYIFDFGWAEAAESNGISYYPKLTSAIPFTPATGSKTLINARLGAAEKHHVLDLLLESAQSLVKKMGASSLHFLFVPANEIERLEAIGNFSRHSFQYHWTNNSYSDFESFLSALKSKRRREIRRERSQVVQQGVTLQVLTGDELRLEHAEIMFQFYLNTIQKMSGHDYLTEDFFKHLFLHMKEKILFVLATNQEGQPVAGALNFLGKKTLYGRYWGCLDEYKALHFEVCYYQGIEFCVKNKFELFEAGAQGEHKFQRGFLPTLTYSAHQLQHAGLNQAVRQFAVQEKKQIQDLFADYDEHSPFSEGKTDPNSLGSMT